MNEQFYACLRYGCVWTDAVKNMRPEYSYGTEIYFFETMEEAEKKASELRENIKNWGDWG